MFNARRASTALLASVFLLVAAACTTSPAGSGGPAGPTTTTTTTIPNVAPIAVANASVTTGTAPLPVNFFSTGTHDPDGNIVSTEWTFGDTATSNLPNPGHTFTTPGVYNVSLKVTDDLGAIDVASVTITVNAPVNQIPTAVANAAPAAGRFPLSVTLLSTGSVDNDGTIVGFSWNYGDGTGGSNEPNPTHTYATPGNYTATLTVTDDDGATGTSSVVVTVSPNTPPVAVASGAPTSGFVALPVAFSSAGSNDLDGSIVSTAWTFGDGGTSNVANPSHTYTTNGTFTATLTVTDSDGATAQQAVTITVTAKAPTATFTKSITAGIAPQTVTFSAAGSADINPGGSIVSYVWGFGDGGTGTGVAPSHQYTTTGTKTITLTVTNNFGVSATATSQTVTIGQFLPPQNFTMYDAAGELAHDGHFYFSWTNVATAPGTVLSLEIHVKASAGCLAWGDHTTPLAATGGAGSTQTYDWSTGWPFSNVCVGSDYDYQARSVRTGGPDGTQYSAWTDWQTKHISHS